MHTYLDAAALESFATHLREDEKSEATIEKYVRDVRSFAEWLGGREPSKDAALLWKAELLRRQYAPATVNAKLAALNRFFLCCGRGECRVKPLRIQRRVFCRSERELTRLEYRKLVDTAQRSRRSRTALIMETICATGIRVSELRYITVEAARRGETSIALKGKVRAILLPRRLSQKLLRYARKNGIGSGSIRHLFAVTYYNVCRDMNKLADVLGHSCIETTRTYLITSGKEHALYLEQLKLVV